MGLLVKLQNGDTALKSLKFGKDRLGGGSSNQPYIKNPIIDNPGQLAQADNDFLLRGGLRAPINAIEDVARLTKYMFDFKSPSGLLFIAKQNILSRVSPKTEAAEGAGYAGGALNAGVYTPLSTLLQAGVGFTGTHLNLMGINPFSPMTGVIEDSFLPTLGLKRYEDVVKRKNDASSNQLSINAPTEAARAAQEFLAQNPFVLGLPPFAQKAYDIPPPSVLAEVANRGDFSNRLLNLWYGKNFNINLDTNILQYGGGPGSILGVGKTSIKFADNQRTGVNNPLFSTNKKFFLTGGKTAPSVYIEKTETGEYKYIDSLNYTTLLGVSKAEGLDEYQTGIDPDTGILTNIFGPQYPYSTLSKSNPTNLSLTGSSGYLVGSPRPKTEINYYNLLGASKLEGLDEYQTGIDLITGLSTNIFGPQYPYYTLSKNNPTGQPLTGFDGYQTIKPYQNLTQESDTTYNSPIEDILNNTYDRQLLSPPQFDPNGIAGDAPTFAATSNNTFIPKYSSDNTLRRDYTNEEINANGGFLWDDFNNPSSNLAHKDGYLADLDKNAGTYKDELGQIIVFNNGYPGGISPDFRLTPRVKRGLPPLPQSAQNTSVTGNNAPNYTKYGTLGDGEVYSRYITDNGALETTTNFSERRFKTLDSIYYKSSDRFKSSFRDSKNLESIGNDLIQFSIVPINPTDPTNTLPSFFRAYIDNFSDSYKASWKSQNYMGRGESFYKYDSFGRDISVDFTVAAESYEQMKIHYVFLNNLASSLAPTYTNAGYLAGNLHYLTVGDYVYFQPGIIESMGIDIADESPWATNLNYPGFELPMYLKVSLKFTPIHTFRPEMIWTGFEDQRKFMWQNNR